MDKRKHSGLIGKAGVGLACFHLARRGYDYTITTFNSTQGDLWVDVDGTIEKIEVKASHQNSWNVRREQIGNVSRVIFVDVADGECWMLPAAEIVRFLLGKGRAKFVVTKNMIEGMGAECLHRDQFRLVPKARRRRSMADYPADAPKTKKVVRTLADGTRKAYFYPRGRA